MTKPHIKRTSTGYVCTGMGVEIDSITATGAYIAWARYVALRIICGQMEVAR